jgi:hypothetical protein
VRRVEKSNAEKLNKENRKELLTNPSGFGRIQNATGKTENQKVFQELMRNSET